MKALTLTQPWASLVAIGAKRIETRSWATNYRGPLAIHAAKGLPNEAKVLFLCTPFHEVLTKAGFQISHMLMAPPKGIQPHNLPLAAVVATCKLSDCLPTEEVFRQYGATRYEREFGDYTPGRWAWVLSNIVALPAPIPARGALGLWELTLPILEALAAFASLELTAEDRALAMRGDPDEGDDDGE